MTVKYEKKMLTEATVFVIDLINTSWKRAKF